MERRFGILSAVLINAAFENLNAIVRAYCERLFPIITQLNLRTISKRSEEPVDAGVWERCRDRLHLGCGGERETRGVSNPAAPPRSEPTAQGVDATADC
ncbi:unnamed protein product [Lampetra planeri]